MIKKRSIPFFLITAVAVVCLCGHVVVVVVVVVITLFLFCGSAFDECDCERAWLCEWSQSVTSTSGCTPIILSIVTKLCQCLGLMRAIYLD